MNNIVKNTVLDEFYGQASPDLLVVDVLHFNWSPVTTKNFTDDGNNDTRQFEPT